MAFWTTTSIGEKGEKAANGRACLLCTTQKGKSNRGFGRPIVKRPMARVRSRERSVSSGGRAQKKGGREGIIAVKDEFLRSSARAGKLLAVREGLVRDQSEGKKKKTTFFPGGERRSGQRPVRGEENAETRGEISGHVGRF